MDKAKSQDVGPDASTSRLMMLGIATVYLTIGLALLTTKQRRRLARQAGKKDEDLDAYILGLNVARYIEDNNEGQGESDVKKVIPG